MKRGVSPNSFFFSFAAAGKKEEKRFFGDTPIPGRGLAALCTPAFSIGRSLLNFLTTPGKRLFLTGDEAVARAALEAGVDVVTGYPGNPSTKTVAALLPLARTYQMTVEWSVNEKVALEVAAGAAWAGKRGLVTMKMSGINVMADSLLSIAHSGVQGALVIYAVDDVGTYYGMVEQDSRYYARLASLPLLMPDSPEEAYQMTLLAFRLSAETGAPVFILSTTAVANAITAMKVGQLAERSASPPAHFERNLAKFTKATSQWCLEQHADALKRLEHAGTLCEQAEQINYILPSASGSQRIGIVVAGVSYTYLEELLRRDSVRYGEIAVLKIGQVHPLPRSILCEFLSKLECVLVLEELEPLIETEVLALLAEMGHYAEVIGKRRGGLPCVGDYSVELVGQALAVLSERAVLGGMTDEMADGMARESVGQGRDGGKLRLYGTGKLEASSSFPARHQNQPEGLVTRASLWLTFPVETELASVSATSDVSVSATSSSDVSVSATSDVSVSATATSDVSVSATSSSDVSVSATATSDVFVSASDVSVSATSAREPSKSGRENSVLPLVRTLEFCPGCPHRMSYYALNRAIERLGFGQGEVITTGDIGCTIIGMNAPLDTCWTEVSMGASIGIAQGLKQAGIEKPILAAMGDATFYHNGIAGLLNALQAGVNLTLLILDNSCSAMTGMQPDAGSGRRADGEPGVRADIAMLARGCGVEYVRRLNPYQLETMIETLRNAMQYPGVSVVIAEAPCTTPGVLIGSQLVQVDQQSCLAGRGCADTPCYHKVGCPSVLLSLDGECPRLSIDTSTCVACGLCVAACPFEAIKPIQTGESGKVDSVSFQQSIQD
jgi:TPP-dependent indolepyruvate ferredoxin oxidoreductase alpha subunit